MIKKLLCIAFLLPMGMYGQDDYLARLPIHGGVSEIGVSPSEEIWVATRGGNVYFTKQIGELWHFGTFNSQDDIGFITGRTFDRVNFFTEDTLMISGFIQEDGKQDFVFWSGNKGENWQKVIFGKSSWIDAAYVNNNGKAWMSGSSQLIYHTVDNGKNWTSFDKVEPSGNLRFSTIHFAKDEQTGLFGSFWNVLYRTVDNCQTWEKLPTPLSQNKYERLSKKQRPDIKKIRIFGNHYIINQQGKVYISSSDSIDWIHLPEINDFEVSENDNLFTINRNLTTSLYNANFEKIWSSEDSLEGHLRAINTRNNSLFVLTYQRIYKINSEEFTSSLLLTDEVPIQEPYLKLEYQGQTYGFSGRDILTFNEKKEKWHRYMTVDFPVENASLFDKKIVLADHSLTKYYTFDPKEKSVQEYQMPNVLFSNLSAKELHFEKGSQGCFHSDNSLRSYRKKGDGFTVDKTSSSSKFLSRAPAEINADTIENIIDIIDASRFKRISLNDLNITEKDISNFKQFIDKEEKRIKKSGIDRFEFDNLYTFPGENTDFDFYRNVADSIHTVSDEDINNAFWLNYGNFSTTTDWRRVVIVLHNGKQLIIENSDDKPNYLYTPWVVDFEGFKFRTNSLLFGQKIDEITNGQFFNETVRDKTYAIFKIADYLYKKKLSGE